MPATPDGAQPLRPSSPPRRPVAALLTRIPTLTATGPVAQTWVTGCTHDSRAVRPGDLYAALAGGNVHGAQFLAAAVAAGATAVLTDQVGAVLAADLGIVVLVAQDPRAVLGDVAAWVHDDPAAGLLTIGVTGTNGKTTTAFLVEAGLRAAGHRTGLLGTVETRIADLTVSSVRTTPEATDLQALLALMRERGVTAVVMEVSSHALSLGRVDGVVFDTVVFTNLTQDHLDFHPTMAAYEAAKASLFRPDRARRGVVNRDDAAGRRLLAGAQIPLTSYGLAADEGGGMTSAVTVHELQLRPDGSRFRLTGAVQVTADIALPGRFNVANATAALVALAVSGVDVHGAADGIRGLAGVAGRMERVDAGQPFLALVDYAHTPDAVVTLLAAVRDLTPGQVIVVLGCGGDRDQGKRPLMAAAAAAGADLVVLTSDNPRSEDPLVILEQMRVGAPEAVVEPDRRRAIALGLALAHAGDVLVVAGKGHESGQEANGRTTAFDDRLVLRELLLESRT